MHLKVQDAELFQHIRVGTRYGILGIYIPYARTTVQVWYSIVRYRGRSDDAHPTAVRSWGPFLKAVPVCAHVGPSTSVEGRGKVSVRLVLDTACAI